ncbi:MAG: phosphopantetheine adenylyltransferase [Euryarchaeota archaeon]|nr:phosphopantetheine adenylyltransferase [Euryarchaeota archaeon]
MIYQKVAVGGTFDKFHKGHKKLLDKAFKVGDKILIGVTSDEFGGKKGDIDPCNVRMSNLEKFLEKFNSRYSMMKLEDHYGSTIDDETLDALVVSRETRPTANKINRIRERRGMNPLEIIVIDMVLAEDGKPISSTRIRKGEIDSKGRII